MTDNELEPGKTYTRAQLDALLGGGTQGGILPSTTSNTIRIYSDHNSGSRFGYVDGWLDDEDDDAGRIFEYTGAGSSGDQSFQGNPGSRNRALLRHEEDGRTVHLFTAEGKLEGSNTKTHRYIGKMVLDKKQPWYPRQAPDETGAMRTVIVFRLRSADGRPPLKKDEIPPAKRTESVLVPADVTTSRIVEPEINKKTIGRRTGTASSIAKRREAQLSDHYRDFLVAQGHDVKRFQLRIKGLTSVLLTDLYDVTAHVLHEIKSSTTREAIREAIGQLLDYRRHVEPPNPKLAIVLPSRPNDDLQDLISSAGISLVYPSNESYIGYPVAQTSAI